MTYLPLCELMNEDLLNNISKTIELTATVTPDNAFKGVIWSSSDETKATVDENGVVTGHQAGEVNITATSAEDETIKATSTITVKSHISQLILRDGGGVENAHYSLSIVFNNLKASNFEAITISLYDGEEKIAEHSATAKTLGLENKTLSSPIYLDQRVDEEYWSPLTMPLKEGRVPTTAVMEFVIDGVSYTQTPTIPNQS